MLNIKFELNEKIENYFNVCLYDDDEKLINLKLSEFEKRYLFNRKHSSIVIFKKEFTYTKDGVNSTFENICLWSEEENENEFIILNQLDYNVKKLILRMLK